MNLEIRVLQTPTNTGIFNTAVDVVIQKAVAQKISPPTILYTNWEPTVSIGYAQKCDADVDLAICEKENVHLVRRKSGGQAVYLDEEYIVYSVIAPRALFPADVTHLRKIFCEVIASALQQHGVPASYYTPDNIVINEKDKIRQIGNSGQLIGKDAVLIHGSIRYARNNLHRLVNVLKINGNPLHVYEDKIKNALASVDQFSGVSKSDLTHTLTQSFATYLGGIATTGDFTAYEKSQLVDIKDYVLSIADEPHFSPKGVCYLFLNGKNIVPELIPLLEYNRPSGT
ncbi:MAG TPA: biotin/lipoate A/B protein ligase family protein [Acidobacteriota bacterium]|nr:biotin/lipoate A/B protein ligase family protein [Acidobacteriota bacterium]